MTFVKGIFVVIVVNCCHLFLFTILHLLAKSWPNLSQVLLFEHPWAKFGYVWFLFIPFHPDPPIWSYFSQLLKLFPLWLLLPCGRCCCFFCQRWTTGWATTSFVYSADASWSFMDFHGTSFVLLPSFIFFYILLSCSTTCLFWKHLFTSCWFANSCIHVCSEFYVFPARCQRAGCPPRLCPAEEEGKRGTASIVSSVNLRTFFIFFPHFSIWIILKLFHWFHCHLTDLDVSFFTALQSWTWNILLLPWIVHVHYIYVCDGQALFAKYDRDKDQLLSQIEARSFQLKVVWQPCSFAVQEP